jgi:integrase
MPRRRAAPRLYLDRGRKQWVIRDGASFLRTGCAEHERDGAEKRLAAYLGQKHTPQRSSTPLIADILLAYSTEHLPYTRAAKNASYGVADLAAWWGDRTLSDITARSCRKYASERRPSSARRNLQTLRAAIAYWHRERGPLPSIPAIVMPPAEARRERWLTRQEVARLLWAARHTPHLARLILIGIYTGSRLDSMLSLRWDWIDFVSGVMLRRGPGTAESKQKRTPPVRLGRRILAHLRRWRRLDSPRCQYVVHYDGQHIARRPGSSWRTAVRRAGLGADVTPHTLRHTRATWLMQKGIDVWEASGHLGMSPAILIKVYGKHSPDFQKQAAEV